MDRSETSEQNIEIDLDSIYSVATANELAASANERASRKRLCGDLWAEGEFALLFGEHGTGKSALAVELANAIAKGKGAEPFEVTTGRRKVLLLDLEMTSGEWASRYAGRTDLSKNLTRVEVNMHTPLPGNGNNFTNLFTATLEPLIRKNRAKVVIIDGITRLKRSNDVTRDLLPVVKELDRLKRTMGLSVLVIARSQTRPRSSGIDTSDLRQGRAMCEIADTAFGMGRLPGSKQCYLKHVFSRNGETKCDASNTAVFSVDQIEGGPLEMELNGYAPERFIPEPSEHDMELIDEIHKLHDTDGLTFTQISERTGTSRSRAHRLYHLWEPDGNGESDEEEDQYDDVAENGWRPTPEKYPGEHTDNAMESMGYGRPRKQRLIESGEWDESWDSSQNMPYAPHTQDDDGELTPRSADAARGANEISSAPQTEAEAAWNVARIPFMGKLPTTIYDLPQMKYKSGRIAYLLKVREPDGAPIEWFTVEDECVTKHTRDSWGESKKFLGFDQVKLE